MDSGLRHSAMTLRVELRRTPAINMCKFCLDGLLELRFCRFLRFPFCL
jgi:hypothetical protein